MESDKRPQQENPDVVIKGGKSYCTLDFAVKVGNLKPTLITDRLSEGKIRAIEREDQIYLRMKDIGKAARRF